MREPSRAIGAMIVLALLPAWLLAQNVDYAGTSTANFLKIGVGSRYVGLGDAGVSLVDDASAMFWNVGALGMLQHGSATFSSMTWLVDTRVTYVAAAVPLGFGTLGFDIDYFSSGDMEITTLQEQDGTGRYFNASDLQIGLGYSRQFTDRLSVGIKVKYIQERLAGTQAGSFAIDLGSVFVTNFLNNLRIGINLSNFGSRMQFDGRDLAVIFPVPDSPSNKEVPARLQTEPWEVPLFFRFGIATHVVRSDAASLQVAYDVFDSRDFRARHNVGAEITLAKLVSLRAGYRFNYSEAGASFGASVDLQRFYSKGLRFDYVASDMGRFDMIQQFSITAGF